MSAQNAVPAIPRVISPSPAPELSALNDRESSRQQDFPSPAPISEERSSDDASGSDSSAEIRARSRSRSPIALSPSLKRRRKSGATKKLEPASNGHVVNGHLSPYATLQGHWRDFSRSPSPLGLIPLHRHYRTLIHRHEIPRKLLHVSIGFVTLDLYRRGAQTWQITPYLFSALVPIAATDFLRHRFQAVNKLYIRCLGALMRETEVSSYNGVIWYLLGAFVVLQFFPKDVGVMGVLLLSWCDTAASTFGRLYGRYTLRLRRGKSLAGTLAAWAMGVITAIAFWGYIAPSVGGAYNDPENPFMFNGSLNLLPGIAKKCIEWVVDIPESVIEHSVVTGPAALGIVSLWSGFVAAGSELIDLFGWDDNLTIPILSGVGIWGFLKVFGT
ncbi:hypothetical protein FQN57_002971 [Myotisia sp. PD_48]|nr:hypothetical protein FQN57_002971 [Myotisia sp. PD_48]